MGIVFEKFNLNFFEDWFAFRVGKNFKKIAVDVEFRYELRACENMSYRVYIKY